MPEDKDIKKKNTEIAATEDGGKPSADVRDAGDLKKKEDKICFLCKRPESVTGPMIDLPNNIHVCQDCMQKSFDAMKNGNIDYSTAMKNMPTFSAIDLSGLADFFSGDASPKKEEEPSEKEVFTMKDILPPHKIKEKLDRYVIGQEQAKKII